MQLDIVPVQALRSGDIIVEGDRKTVVKQVDTTACHGHVHINNADCWDYGYPVTAYLGE